MISFIFKYYRIKFNFQKRGKVAVDIKNVNFSFYILNHHQKLYLIKYEIIFGYGASKTKVSPKN